MHNEELHKLYFSPNIISAAKFEENRPQGRHRHREEGNIKFKEIRQDNVDWTGFIWLRTKTSDIPHGAGNFLIS